MSRHTAPLQLTIGHNAAILIGRVLLAAMFIRYGYSKIGAFSGTAGAIASRGVPLAELAAAVAIFIELGLGLCVLAGYKTRAAAAMLGLYLAFITPLFHNFWALPAAQQMAQEQSFYKNLSAVGGLLILAVFGAGGWSLDARRVPCAPRFGPSRTMTALQ